MYAGVYLMQQVVHLGLQAVHEDHFPKVSPDWPSDGPVVICSSHEHVQHHSGGSWPTSLSEVHRGHLSATTSQGPRISAMRRLSRLGCGNHGHLTHRPRSGLLNHIVRLDCAACLACSNCSNVVNGSSIDMVLEWSLQAFC